MKVKIYIPGWIKYWLLLKYAELKYEYHKIMGKIRIKDLSVGDFVYRVNPVNGRVLEYTIDKIDGSWFNIANETGYVCASIQSHNLDIDNFNGEYYTSAFMAIWMKIREIRNKQYRLEQQRLKIIKTNKIKVKINGRTQHWWNNFIKIKNYEN